VHYINTFTSSDYDDSTCSWQTWEICGHLSVSSLSLSFLFVWVLRHCCFIFFSLYALFRAHFIYRLSASISSPSSSVLHQMLLQAQFSCPGFNYRLPSVKKLIFAAPATATVGSALNVCLFWCALLSRKKCYIYFLNGYKQKVIFVFPFFLKSVPLVQMRFFLLSQNDVRVSVPIVKVFYSYFTTGSCRFFK